MKEKTEKVLTLLDKANEDYSASAVLFECEDFDYHCDSICFHSQQCVEKSLKAFLMHNEIDYPKTHDLLLLLDLCIEIDENFNDFDLSEFSGFGVEIRYDDISPTIVETEKAFKIAKKVMDYIKGCINN